MTRLTHGDLNGLAGTLQKFDRELAGKCGCTLRQLACRAMGIPEERLLSTAGETPVAVIPVTAGQGVIMGFAETVEAIASYLGFPARVTLGSDVAGLAEALAERSGIVILADDLRYIAVNLQTLFVADNTPCTAKGFVTALELMAGCLKGRQVLILGCGLVGSHACRFLVDREVKITLYDIANKQSLRLAREIKMSGHPLVNVEAELGLAMFRHELIVDACPAPDIIDKGWVTEKTYIVAPGVPSGVTPSARELLTDRYLHDPLQIGTAVMLVAAAFSMLVTPPN